MNCDDEDKGQLHGRKEREECSRTHSSSNTTSPFTNPPTPRTSSNKFLIPFRWPRTTSSLTLIISKQAQIPSRFISLTILSFCSKLSLVRT